MNTDERLKDDDEEAGDKYLNVEIIMNMDTNDADKWFNIRGDWTANLKVFRQMAKVKLHGRSRWLYATTVTRSRLKYMPKEDLA
jgi:hypothetical protein